MIRTKIEWTLRQTLINEDIVLIVYKRDALALGKNWDVQIKVVIGILCCMAYIVDRFPFLRKKSFNISLLKVFKLKTKWEINTFLKSTPLPITTW